MKEIAKYILIIIISGILGMILGLFAQKRLNKPIVKTETITYTVHDTTIVESPKIIERLVVDTILVAVIDTVMISDTVYVHLPRERIVASDSTYRVVASGFMPSIDTVQIFSTRTNTVEYVCREARQKRWGIGIQAGIGVGYNGKIQAAPYIGVGISYDIFSF